MTHHLAPEDRTAVALSWSQALFRDESLDRSLCRLARYGYTHVELPAHITPAAEVKRALWAHGLACSSVNASYIGADRDLSAADPSQRQTAIDHVFAHLDYAAEIGAPFVIVVPTRIGKLAPEISVEQDWATAVDSLATLGTRAESIGVGLVIEAVNRAESYLVNRLETASHMARQSGSAQVAIMADNFHMNIEESDPYAALRAAAPLLRHVHLADNNRMAPGMGHLDFAVFLRTLREIGFTGPLTMECDVQTLDALGRSTLDHSPAHYDQYAQTARDTLLAALTTFTPAVERHTGD